MGISMGSYDHLCLTLLGSLRATLFLHLAMLYWSNTAPSYFTGLAMATVHIDQLVDFCHIVNELYGVMFYDLDDSETWLTIYFDDKTVFNMVIVA